MKRRPDGFAGAASGGRTRVDELACVSVLDGAVRLIFAGWLPQDGLFGRSASAGLGNERGFKGVNPIAVHSRNAGHSTRSRLLVFLVRLLFCELVEETSLAEGGAESRKVVPRSRRFLPVRGRSQRGARAA